MGILTKFGVIVFLLPSNGAVDEWRRSHVESDENEAMEAIDIEVQLSLIISFIFFATDSG